MGQPNQAEISSSVAEQLLAACAIISAATTNEISSDMMKKTPGISTDALQTSKNRQKTSTSVSGLSLLLNAPTNMENIEYSERLRNLASSQSLLLPNYNTPSSTSSKTKKQIGNSYRKIEPSRHNKDRFSTSSPLTKAETLKIEERASSTEHICKSCGEIFEKKSSNDICVACRPAKKPEVRPIVRQRSSSKCVSQKIF